MNALGKQVVAILPAEVIGEAPAVAAVVDTLNADLAIFDLVAGEQTGTTAPDVLKLQECSTSDGEFADVAAFLGGTAFAFPATLEAGWGVRFVVDLRKRLRFLKLAVTPKHTVTLAAVASLFKTEQPATTAAAAGVVALVEG